MRLSGSHPNKMWQIFSLKPSHNLNLSTSDLILLLTQSKIINHTICYRLNEWINIWRSGLQLEIIETSIQHIIQTGLVTIQAITTSNINQLDTPQLEGSFYFYIRSISTFIENNVNEAAGSIRDYIMPRCRVSLIFFLSLFFINFLFKKPVLF